MSDNIKKETIDNSQLEQSTGGWAFQKPKYAEDEYKKAGINVVKRRIGANIYFLTSGVTEINKDFANDLVRMNKEHDYVLVKSSPKSNIINPVIKPKA